MTSLKKRMKAASNISYLKFQTIFSLDHLIIIINIIHIFIILKSHSKEFPFSSYTLNAF